MVEMNEEVVLQILSYLPTRQAIRASLVCPEWRSCWKKVPIIDFRHWQGSRKEREDEDHPEADSFQDFVDLVLEKIDKASLKKFYLGRTASIDQKKIEKWIATLIGKFSIEELLIDARFKRKPIILPHSMFKHTSSLTKLNLQMNTIFDLCRPMRFDRLKSLTLSRVKFSGDTNVKSQQELVCPALEELSLICVRMENIESLSIRAPSLKRLVVSGWGRTTGVQTYDPDSEDDEDGGGGGDSDDDDDRHFGYPSSHDLESGLSRIRLHIAAPSLLYLRFTEEFPADFNVSNWDSVEEAEIHCLTEDKRKLARSTYTLLNRLQNVRRLVLLLNSLEALSVDAYGLQLPIFHHLTRLEVGEYFHCYRHQSLFLLIELAPILCTLVFALPFCQLNDVQERDFYPWKAFDAPDSIFSHLHFIEFRKLDGNEPELKMIESLLRDSINLKLMTIYSVYDGEMEDRILSFPRASTSCVLEFPPCSDVTY